MGETEQAFGFACQKQQGWAAGSYGSGAVALFWWWWWCFPGPRENRGGVWLCGLMGDTHAGWTVRRVGVNECSM